MRLITQKKGTRSWSATSMLVALLALMLVAASCSSGGGTSANTSTGENKGTTKTDETAPGASGKEISPEEQELFKLRGVAVREGTEGEVVPAGTYKKEGPWKVGMSHFGVNANTWTVQVAHEAEAAAAKDSRIEELILLDANGDQAKQVSDIEDLIAQEVDVLIVMPVTSTSADAGIEAAEKAGIPVVVHTGRTETDAYTTEFQGGAEHFGRVMGDFLVKELDGKGKIWVLRGAQGHPEDINRYRGLEQALEGTDIEIVAEDVGNWTYDNGKDVCETFILNNPEVDGIWSSGADMTRACIDVFKEFGEQLPPITGEGNNGYFGRWIEEGVSSISPEYGPAQGAVGIRMATALLDGEELSKSYVYQPDPLDIEDAKELYRPDLSANVWWPTELSEEELQELYGE